jgi:hypothetical protein
MRRRRVSTNREIVLTAVIGATSVDRLVRRPAEKLGLYCAQNPKMSVLSAAENVMDK